MDNFFSFLADFGFIYPEWLLALIPLVFVIPWLNQTETRTGLIAPHLARLLSKNQEEKAPRATWPVTLLGASWLIAVIALAGPSFKTTEIPASTLSGARVLVMDMSRSMYAVDIAPNRLTQAQYKALDMLPGWKEGSTGLVTYAGDAYTVSPLTEDADTLASLIPYLSPELMPVQGSNGAAGIKEAISLLKQAGFEQGDIILITDGMSETESEQSLAALKEEKIRVSVLAIGTQEGAPIKLPTGDMLEENGKLIVAKLDLSTLTPITQATGGILQVWQATNTDVDNILALTQTPIQGKAQHEGKQSIQERRNEGFWLIIPLLAFALLSFRRGAVLAFMFVLLPPEPAFAAPFKNTDQIGFEHFNAGDFDAAAKAFHSPSWKGIAQYKAGDYQGAIETLSPLTDPNSRYNLGNAYAQAGDLEKAKSTYKKLLNDHPNIEDAKKNLEIIEKAQQEQEKNKDQSQKDQSQNSDQKNQQENQNDQQKQDQQEGQNKQDENKNGARDKQEEQKDQGKQGENNSEPGSDDKQEGQNKQDENKSGTGDKQEPKADQNNQDNKKESDSGDKEGQQADQDKQGEPGSNSDKLDKENKEDKANAADSLKGAEEKAGDKEDDAKENGATLSDNPQDQINASHPVLKKLEQVPDSTAALIRAQLLLQSRQKETPKQTDNSW